MPTWLWTGAQAAFPCLCWSTFLQPSESGQRLPPVPPSWCLPPSGIIVSFLFCCSSMRLFYLSSHGLRLKVHTALLDSKSPSKFNSGAGGKLGQKPTYLCLSAGRMGVDTQDASHLLFTVPFGRDTIVIPTLWQLQCYVNLPVNGDFYLLFPDS